MWRSKRPFEELASPTANSSPMRGLQVDRPPQCGPTLLAPVRRRNRLMTSGDPPTARSPPIDKGKQKQPAMQFQTDDSGLRVGRGCPGQDCQKFELRSPGENLEEVDVSAVVAPSCQGASQRTIEIEPTTRCGGATCTAFVQVAGRQGFDLDHATSSHVAVTPSSSPTSSSSAGSGRSWS